jgi:hypothetical protein
MIRKIILLTIIVFPFFRSFAQESTTVSESENIFTYLQHDSINKGHVTIIQDKNIERLFCKYVEINEQQKGFHGYRIRIFSDSGQLARDNANKVKTTFYTLYPDVESYLKYDAPNFKVLVGDFRTKSEALNFLKVINKDFVSAFIVKDLINYPKTQAPQ